MTAEIASILGADARRVALIAAAACVVCKLIERNR